MSANRPRIIELLVTSSLVVSTVISVAFVLLYPAYSDRRLSVNKEYLIGCIIFEFLLFVVATRTKARRLQWLLFTLCFWVAACILHTATKILPNSIFILVAAGTCAIAVIVYSRVRDFTHQVTGA